MVLHSPLHFADEREDAVGAAVRVRLDEVRVPRGHLRRSEAEPPTTRRVDDAPRRVPLRIDEHRAGVLPARLVLTPPADDLLDRPKRSCRVALDRPKGGG